MRGYFDWHERPGYWRDVTSCIASESYVLDVGCGNAWMCACFDDYQGVDVDLSAVPDPVRERVRVGSAQDLPFAQGTFDAVVMKDVLEHLDDPAAAVSEAFRVLRPGGVAYAASPDAQRWVWNDYTHKRPFTKIAFTRLFVDSGFTIETLRYETLVRGVSQISAAVGGNRRPWWLRWTANVPGVRRNVVVVASKPRA